MESQDKNKTGNNLGIDIPKYLSSHYKNWQKECPQILQLDNDLNVVREWPNKKAILNYFQTSHIQAIDLSIRKSVRYCGYFFVIKALYDIGLRPIVTARRNEQIYAYNPSPNILTRYYDYEELTLEDFYKPEEKSQFEFIMRYNSSVETARDLDLSVTNIRSVAKQQNILLHKDYFFSFEPLMHIHYYVAEIYYYSKRAENYMLHQDELEHFEECVKKYKEENLLEENQKRRKGNLENKLEKIIYNCDDCAEIRRLMVEDDVEEEEIDD